MLEGLKAGAGLQKGKMSSLGGSGGVAGGAGLLAWPGGGGGRSRGLDPSALAKLYRRCPAGRRGPAPAAPLFTADQPRQPAASGVAKLMPRLHRDYDSGLSIGLDATLTASDALSRGRYGGDVFEKAYGEVRTGLGRLEIGPDRWRRL